MTYFANEKHSGMMVMKSFFYVLIGTLVFVLFSCSCSFSPYESDLLNRRPNHRPQKHEVYMSQVCSYLIMDYRVPINDEVFSLGHALRTIPYEIGRWERLQSALDRIIEATEEPITYELIHGQLCLVPIKLHEDDVLSPLDLRVTVTLGTISTWEAIKEVNIALNQQKEKLDKPVLIEPEEVEWLKEVTPQLTQPQEFNLSLQNISARDALCVIFAASKLNINYYFSYRRANFYVIKLASYPERFSESLKFRSERVDMEEACWWYREVDELMGAWNVVPKYQQDRESFCSDIPSPPLS